ncbi:MAG: hypothetical protein FWG10_06220 [Eubacteriaceae bacterium]|nr:hypothetical protein [Eubacteriaceae bacterium]
MGGGIDKRTLGHKRRLRALVKESGLAVEFAVLARKNKIPFKYVLAGSWFSFPIFFAKLKAASIERIARLKKMPNVYCLWEGQKLTLSQIYRKLPKKRGKAKLLCEAFVSTIPSNEGKIAARLKIVFVRNKNKKKEWLAIASTDISLENEEIVRLFDKRCGVEVFFKVAKSNLGLAKEFSCRSFDSLTACTAIVFLRYTEAQRDSSDPRTIGFAMRQETRYSWRFPTS